MSTIPKEIRDKINKRYNTIGKFFDRESAEYGYQLATDGREELEKENATMNKMIIEKDDEILALKNKVNGLIMDNMTHEYNQAEGIKFAPEMNRQLVTHHLKNIREGGYYPSGYYWFQGELYWDDDAIYELSK